jgi:hypothetical protein
VVKNYERIRFFLFTNSYSGQKISTYIKIRFQGRELVKAIKRLSVIFNFNYSQVINYILFDLKPTSPYKRLPVSLKIYLEIESELVKLSEERLDDYSTAIDDYQHKLLYPAIERTVGNLLENIDDDSEFQNLFDEKTKSATHIYYKVAYRYKLPTMRIVPFILRLIS